MTAMTLFVHRDFWDAPRVIFTQSDPVYLLDCPFDEEKDDYPDYYRVYEVKNLNRENLRGSWANLDLDKTFVRSIKVSVVIFDSTIRREVDLSFLTSPDSD